MRCFVIGNGPSLNYTPLERLMGETTFACNRINKLFDRTKWRPTYYVRAEPWYDPLTINDEIGAVMEIGCKLYLNRGFYSYWRNNGMRRHREARLGFFDHCAEHTFLQYDDENVPETWHLPRICGFGGSVPVAIQLAVMNGYDEIYLLGCDLGFEDGKTNHFCDDYERHQSKPAQVLNNVLIKAHQIAAKSSPVPIYNATIGGNLEVYPRVDINNVLEVKRGTNNG